eukprot:3227016-Pyramimonas_sp.AAC.1
MLHPLLRRRRCWLGPFRHGPARGGGENGREDVHAVLQSPMLGPYIAGIQACSVWLELEMSYF